jgi:sugar phosphate isomerase/epimerase
MNLSVSNVSFEDDKYDQYLSFLLDVGISKIEIAPFKHFKSWDIKEYKKIDRFEIVSTQGIFFNQNLNLFNDLDSFKKHFKKVIEINKILGSSYTVFGSPAVRRKPDSLSEQEAYRILNEAIHELSNDEVKISIELLPEKYNCNFFNSSKDIEKINFNNYISLHFDTGCIYLTGEQINDCFIKNKKIIRNVHISEPFLNSLNETIINHVSFKDCLKKEKFNGNISLEMKQTDFELFKKSVLKFINLYGE